MAGILAIDVLLQVENDATQLAIFGSYLRLALINSDQSTVPAVASVLGRLVKCGGILTADVVDREARKALDWCVMFPLSSFADGGQCVNRVLFPRIGYDRRIPRTQRNMRRSWF